MFSQRLLTFVSLVVSAYGLISQTELEENTAKGLRLISLQDGVDPIWMTEEEKLRLMADDTNFFDVTEFYDPEEEASDRRVAAALEITYTAVTARRPEVVALLAQVSQSQSQSYLNSLTAYNNRYYRTQDGANAAIWIRDTIAAIASQTPASRATATLFTNSFVQGSVIGTIPGTNPSLPRIILGAHLDSINSSNPTNGRAPGADDDGSGCVNLLEAFRVLVSSGFRPSATVEFHWYGGEEAGLLGSQAIARKYKADGVQVKAMINFDMTAFFRPGSREVISLVPDYVNANLNTQLGTIIDTYLRLPWVRGDPCNYACSDHAPWHQQGYPAAYPFESLDVNMNTVIHSASDTTSLAGFSWSHLLEFTKLAVAAAYELAI
ncbi:aminopeptidase [Coprinopsis cinerea AmutBmut pab1-1]|nr:aminopeptidase [Coprinopsis cinerea AmutBmut pab1-1]